MPDVCPHSVLQIVVHRSEAYINVRRLCFTACRVSLSLLHSRVSLNIKALFFRGYILKLGKVHKMLFSISHTCSLSVFSRPSPLFHSHPTLGTSLTPSFSLEFSAFISSELSTPFISLYVAAPSILAEREGERERESRFIKTI